MTIEEIEKSLKDKFPNANIYHFEHTDLGIIQDDEFIIVGSQAIHYSKTKKTPYPSKILENGLYVTYLNIDSNVL